MPNAPVPILHPSMTCSTSAMSLNVLHRVPHCAFRGGHGCCLHLCTWAPLHSSNQRSGLRRPLAPRSLARLLVVGDERVLHERARAVRVGVGGHVVLLVQHQLAHLIPGLGRDLVARAVDLPRDRRVARADLASRDPDSAGSAGDRACNQDVR